MEENKKGSVLSPKETAEKIIRVLNDKKARSMKLLYVEKQTILADYFIICSGTSGTQIKALAGEVEFKLAEEGILPRHIEGYAEASWVVLDYASVIVHIFGSETRNFYNLEKLWNDAAEVDITPYLNEE